MPNPDQATVSSADVAALRVQASDLKKECEEALNGGVVFVEKMMAALHSLQPARDFEDVGRISVPPSYVMDIMAALLALFGRGDNDRDWTAAQAELKAGAQFIQKLKNLKELVDSNKMNRDHVEGARRYLQLEHVGDPQKMKAKSMPLSHLAEFLVNMISYHDWYVQTKPKINALSKARQKLAMAEAAAGS